MWCLSRTEMEAARERDGKVSADLEVAPCGLLGYCCGHDGVIGVVGGFGVRFGAGGVDLSGCRVVVPGRFALALIFLGLVQSWPRPARVAGQVGTRVARQHV